MEQEHKVSNQNNFMGNKMVYLHKQWFEFAFNNPDLIRPAHGAMMSWLIELNNRMDWRDKFSSSAYQTMAATGISSYNTYKIVFNDLVTWGFVIVVTESKNQHTLCIISLCCRDLKEITVKKENVLPPTIKKRFKLTVNEIKEKKLSGDLVTVSKMLKLTPDIVGASLKRENSKHHTAVTAALCKIITDRENLINLLQ